MKRAQPQSHSHCHFIAFACLGFGLVALPALPALAENVVWNGAPPPALQDTGFGAFDLAPSGSLDPVTGFFKSNSLSGNRVTVNGDLPLGGNVYGALNDWDADDVTGNRVIMNSGSVDLISGGSSMSGNATNNSVTFNGGTINSSVFGGVSTFGNAVNNRVTVSGGDMADAIGGSSVEGDATGNSVHISGGTVLTDVLGGESTYGAANNNSVTISGGKVSGNVWGGNSTFGNATGNSVTISGGTVSGNVWGGMGTIGNNDYFTGNTLNIWNTNGNSMMVGVTVRNFQNLNFVFPVSMAQSGAPVLTVGAAYLGNNAGSGSTVTANTISGTAPLQPGETVTLIQGGIVPQGFTQTQANGQHGATLSTNWALAIGAFSADLTATLNSVQAAPQAKALSEGYLAGPMLLNQSLDFLTGKGIGWAKDASAADKPAAGSGLGFFGGIQGGWNRYDTGSHVNVAGVSLLAGLSQGKDFNPGHLTLGGFFEYGYGSYDTYNSFSNAPSIKSKGDVQHYGVGILGRLDAAFGGYAESSLRVGGVRSKFKGNDLTDAMGNSANFTTTTAYYGIHLGAGYIRNLSEKTSLDLYAKTFWTRQQGDSLTLSTDDPVKFKDVDSHRLRLGGRVVFVMNESVSPYAGAAFEHEFDGKARASTYGFSIDTAKLQGSTGIGELGVTVKPSKGLPLSLDLGLQGYVGRREGATGSVQVRYEF